LPAALAELVKTRRIRQDYRRHREKSFATIVESGRGAAEIVAAEGLSAQVNEAAIEQAAREIISKDPANVAKFKPATKASSSFSSASS